ncbi:MAG: hypothetical protein J6C40_00925 [Lentisphaeria bacterium]|nr:hypothetical protein [Lentisphaeria bacterium]
MTKKILSVALIALGAFAADAKILTTRCVVCNEKIVVNTDKDPSYSVGIGAPQEAKSGYYCDPAESPGCEKKVNSWHEATFSKAKEIMLDLHAKGQSNKKQKQIVKNTAAKLKTYFIVAANKKVPVNQQVAVMNKLVSKCNAEDFWCAMVQGASLDVIKHYWPEATSEKMRDEAAKVIENHRKAQNAAARKRNQQMLRTLFTATADPRSGDPAKQVTSMFMPEGVTIAEKTTITPFAIGRSKKDNSIMFTDGERFSKALLNAAALANRHDVINYFAKQCGSLSNRISVLIFIEMIKDFGAKEKTMFHANEELKSLKNQLTKCDTEREKKQINAKIRHYNYILKKNNYKVCTSTLELLAERKIFSASVIRKIVEAISRELADPMAGVDMMAVAFELQGRAAKGDAAGALNSLSDAMDRRLDKEQLKRFEVVARKNICEKVINSLAASKKAVGKKMQWYAAVYKNWKPGVVDIHEAGYFTEKEPGKWAWKAGITLPSGYTSVGVLNKNNSPDKGVKWLPGRKVKSRPGYVTGDKKDTFVWKAGIPDTGKIGFVSDKKEGTFTAAPGFVLKDGKAVWTAGLKHPKYKGIISTDKMFFWMPDATHLWVEAADSNLAAQKDYETLHSAAQAGAVVAAGVAVSALR